MGALTESFAGALTGLFAGSAAGLSQAEQRMSVNAATIRFMTNTRQKRNCSMIPTGNPFRPFSLHGVEWGHKQTIRHARRHLTSAVGLKASCVGFASKCSNEN